MDVEQDVNPDPSIVHLYHDPLFTSHQNKEGVRPVGRMVELSKISAHEERWLGSS